MNFPRSRKSMNILLIMRIQRGFDFEFRATGAKQAKVATSEAMPREPQSHTAEGCNYVYEKS